MLFTFNTPTDNKPQAVAGNIISNSTLPTCKKYEPRVPNKPKNINTEISPKPLYPYGFFPIV